MEIKKLVVLSINKGLGYISDIKKDLEPYTLGLKRSLWRKKFFTFSIGQDKYTKLILETTFLYLFFQFEDIKSIFTNKKLIQIC